MCTHMFICMHIIHMYVCFKYRYVCVRTHKLRSWDKWSVCSLCTWGSWVLKSEEQSHLETQVDLAPNTILSQKQLNADTETSMPILESWKWCSGLLPSSRCVVTIRQSLLVPPSSERSMSATGYTAPSFLWLESHRSPKSSLCLNMQGLWRRNSKRPLLLF